MNKHICVKNILEFMIFNIELFYVMFNIVRDYVTVNENILVWEYVPEVAWLLYNYLDCK